MNALRIASLSTLAGLCILGGCSSTGSAPAPSASDDSAQADSVVLPQLSPFEKRLKFARLPARITMSAENVATPEDLAVMSRAGYPAFAPNVPQVVNNGGPTLKNPRIVTVTWDGDVNRDAYEAFGDKIGSTSYWRDNTAEYGVGPATSGADNHVHIHDAITTISDQGIDDLVRANVTNTASGWPAPDQQTPAALAAHQRSEIERWWPVIKAANIKAE